MPLWTTGICTKRYETRFSSDVVVNTSVIENNERVEPSWEYGWFDPLFPPLSTLVEVRFYEVYEW